MTKPRSPTSRAHPSRRERLRRANAPLGWGSALAGFALLCGVILLFSASGHDCSGSAPNTLSSAAAQVQNAIETTQGARSALQGQNYGEAQRALDELQNTLSGLLQRLAPQKTKAPAEEPPFPTQVDTKSPLDDRTP
ncbi:MAG: hypothetical protein KAI47_23020 [Deltaproteobacteria bacterium]|nr:hypothetical protein [Deltaproteobacteria bacterium]